MIHWPAERPVHANTPNNAVKPDNTAPDRQTGLACPRATLSACPRMSHAVPGREVGPGVSLAQGDPVLDSGWPMID